MSLNKHTHHSSYREMLLEHLFLGELMRYLWINKDIHLEVLKPQVDDSGYDLVVEANSIIRHIQLKSSFEGSTTRYVDINIQLASKPSGCVIWLNFDPNTLQLGPFYWFGGLPEEPLPDIMSLQVAKHTKANAEGKKSDRPNLRRIGRSKFMRIDSMDDLVEQLFG